MIALGIIIVILLALVAFYYLENDAICKRVGDLEKQLEEQKNTVYFGHCEIIKDQCKAQHQALQRTMANTDALINEKSNLWFTCLKDLENKITERDEALKVHFELHRLCSKPEDVSGFKSLIYERLRELDEVVRPLREKHMNKMDKKRNAKPENQVDKAVEDELNRMAELARAKQIKEQQEAMLSKEVGFSPERIERCFDKTKMKKLEEMDKILDKDPATLRSITKDSNGSRAQISTETVSTSDNGCDTQ